MTDQAGTTPEGEEGAPGWSFPLRTGLCHCLNPADPYSGPPMFAVPVRRENNTCDALNVGRIAVIYTVSDNEDSRLYMQIYRRIDVYVKAMTKTSLSLIQVYCIGPDVVDLVHQVRHHRGH